MIGTVGEMHRFKTDRVALRIDDTLFANNVAFVSVGRIDMHSGLGGVDIKRPTADIVDKSGGPT